MDGGLDVSAAVMNRTRVPYLRHNNRKRSDWKDGEMGRLRAVERIENDRDMGHDTPAV